MLELERRAAPENHAQGLHAGQTAGLLPHQSTPDPATACAAFTAAMVAVAMLPGAACASASPAAAYRGCHDLPDSGPERPASPLSLAAWGRGQMQERLVVHHETGLRMFCVVRVVLTLPYTAAPWFPA